MNIFSLIGKYFLFIKKVFSRPTSFSVFYKSFLNEVFVLGVSSIGFVAFVSLFVGAVVTLQIAYNLDNSEIIDS